MSIRSVDRPSDATERVDLPLTSNMLLTLPQETVNEVIAHLHSDERALQYLSVVAKRLTEECRRYLFASIHIASGADIFRWCHTIPPGDDGLSRYVRLLDFDTPSDGFWCLSTLLRQHPAHLYSFTQVEQLKICPLDLRRHTEKDLLDSLGHLPSTVRSIYIRPAGDYSSTLDFLALFPHLEATHIASPLIYQDPEVVGLPDLVRRGDLILKDCRIDTGANIFSCLTRPTSCYRRVVLGLVKMENPAPLERFFEACSGSLQSIQFISCVFGERQAQPLVASYSYRRFEGPLVHCPSNLLSSLTELQEIKLSLRFYNDNDYFDVLTILSSVTSTKITSVTLFVWGCPSPDSLGYFSLRWLKIESALCRLWELKKGTEPAGGVVVDVRFDRGGLADGILRLSERGEFMPRFQEGGVVNVRTQPIDLKRVMDSITPEGFRETPS